MPICKESSKSRTNINRFFTGKENKKREKKSIWSGTSEDADRLSLSSFRWWVRMYKLQLKLFVLSILYTLLVLEVRNKESGMSENSSTSGLPPTSGTGNEDGSLNWRSKSNRSMSNGGPVMSRTFNEAVAGERAFGDCSALIGSSFRGVFMRISGTAKPRGGTGCWLEWASWKEDRVLNRGVRSPCTTGLAMAAGVRMEEFLASLSSCETLCVGYGCSRSNEVDSSVSLCGFRRMRSVCGCAGSASGVFRISSGKGSSAVGPKRFGSESSRWSGTAQFRSRNWLVVPSLVLPDWG